MDVLTQEIIETDPENVLPKLKLFIEQNSQTFTFPELDENDKKAKLWDKLQKITLATKDSGVLINTFSVVRILSRDKKSLDNLVTKEWVNLLMDHACLNDQSLVFNKDKELVAVEAQKCLCNIIFNSRKSAEICCDLDLLKKICQRIDHYKDDNFPNDVKFFDMKILFIITATLSETRRKVQEYNALDRLLEFLDLILKQAAQLPNEPTKIFLNDQQVDLVCEILKALFNLTLNPEDNPEEMCKYINLVQKLRIYLLIPTNSKEKTFMVQNNVINLLTNVPTECLEQLILPINEGQKIPKKLQYDNYNMTAIYELLLFLKDRFKDEPTVSKQHEMLSPVVSVLFKCANNNRRIRKYLRMQILPPLKDVHSRPEQGNTLRNCLCRLLTTPITQLRDLVADLLFVICKKNVGRMIKYTGYGNAAGLFAKRGLLGGKSDKGEEEFSSDSEDSETEEYAEFKHGINPVIGCYEEPHPNVMENMTEEQKEYEAMKLVELIDNLTKCGVIQPCRVGEDGKPHPIEHVLQLQEGLKKDQIKNNSDSDD